MVVLAMERTIEQRMNALEAANAIRKYRADLKRRASQGYSEEGLKVVREVLLDPDRDERLEAMKVAELLGAVRSFGPSKITKLFKATGISNAKTLGGLTNRQRDALHDALWVHEMRSRDQRAKQAVQSNVA